jgi:hypothetical protein
LIIFYEELLIENSIYLDYDTDEETDKLLGVEHRINAKNQAIRDAVCWNIDKYIISISFSLI